MTKLLLLSREYPPSTSGAAITIYNYIKNLNFDFTVITEWNPENTPKNIRIKPIHKTKTYRYLNTFIFLFGSFFKSLFEDFDCIVGNVMVGSLSASFVKLFKNKPMISIIYDIDFVDKDVKQYGSINKFFRILAFRFIFYMSDSIASMSQSTKEDIMRLFGSHLKDKIFIISVGVEIIPFEKLERPKERIILFVGALYKKRGLEYLIEAFRSVSSKVDNVTLWIIGGRIINLESYYSKLEKLAEGLNVKFFGKVYDNIFRYYDICEILVTPSYHSEGGISLPVLEASAMGKPIIVTDIFKDCMIPDKTGLMVKKQDSNELAEAMITLLNDEKLRETFGANGKEYAKQFNWDDSGKKLEEEIRRLIK